MASAGGPIHVSPAAATAAANCSFSRKEAVAGMDGIGLRPGGDVENGLLIQIGLPRRVALERIHLVGVARVDGSVTIGVSGDRDRDIARVATGPSTIRSAISPRLAIRIRFIFFPGCRSFIHEDGSRMRLTDPEAGIAVRRPRLGAFDPEFLAGQGAGSNEAAAAEEEFAHDLDRDRPDMALLLGAVRLQHDIFGPHYQRRLGDAVRVGFLIDEDRPIGGGRLEPGWRRRRGRSASTRFASPRKSATNRVRGRKYSSLGVAYC